MSKAAKQKKTVSKSTNAIQPIAKQHKVTDRAQLVKSLVDLYAAQDKPHTISQQKQFAVLITGHWHDLPIAMKSDIHAKIGARKDIDASVKILFGKSNTTPEKLHPEATKSKSKNAPAKKSAAQSVTKGANSVWWQQTELFFEMHTEARRAAILEAGNFNIATSPFEKLNTQELVDLRNQYFAGKVNAVQEQVSQILNLPSAIVEMAFNDKDLFGLCIILKALGGSDRDINSFIIFNAQKLQNPSQDSFACAHWFENVPAKCIENIIGMWQNKNAEVLKAAPADLNENNTATMAHKATKPVTTKSVAARFIAVSRVNITRKK